MGGGGGRQSSSSVGFVIPIQLKLGVEEDWGALTGRGVVGVGEEGVLDDDATTPAGLENLDEVLKEKKSRLARADEIGRAHV